LANTSVNVLATDSRGRFGLKWPQGDVGSTGVPTSTFNSLQAGPGTLSVTRQTNVYPSGRPFHSVSVQFKNTSQIPVTWE
jgi:hypothetical protein